MSKLTARRGDPQGRLIADPTVRANPVAFSDELRAQGPIVKCRFVWMTVDHEIANDLLRSDDFRVIAMGSNLPKPLQWVARHTETGLLHPLKPPSMLSVEPPDHTRYRKLVSSVFTTRAVAALRDRVEETANTLLDQLEDGEYMMWWTSERYCSQLPVSDRRHSRRARPRATPHPRVRRAGRAQSGHRPDLGAVPAGQSRHRGSNGWLADHLQGPRRNPRRRPDEPDHSGLRRGRSPQRRRTAGDRRFRSWPQASRRQSTC